MTENDTLLEVNERISQRFFDITLELIKELEAEGDEAGLDTLPTVMVTTGVMALCRRPIYLRIVRARVDGGLGAGPSQREWGILRRVKGCGYRRGEDCILRLGQREIARLGLACKAAQQPLQAG